MFDFIKFQSSHPTVCQALKGLIARALSDNPSNPALKSGKYRLLHPHANGRNPLWLALKTNTSGGEYVIVSGSIRSWASRHEAASGDLSLAGFAAALDQLADCLNVDVSHIKNARLLKVEVGCTLALPQGYQAQQLLNKLDTSLSQICRFTKAGKVYSLREMVGTGPAKAPQTFRVYDKGLELIDKHHPRYTRHIQASLLRVELEYRDKLKCLDPFTGTEPTVQCLLDNAVELARLVTQKVSLLKINWRDMSVLIDALQGCKEKRFITEAAFAFLALHYGRSGNARWLHELVSLDSNNTYGYAKKAIAAAERIEKESVAVLLLQKLKEGVAHKMNHLLVADSHEVMP